MVIEIPSFGSCGPTVFETQHLVLLQRLLPQRKAHPNRRLQRRWSCRPLALPLLRLWLGRDQTLSLHSMLILLQPVIVVRQHNRHRWPQTNYEFIPKHFKLDPSAFEFKSLRETRGYAMKNNLNPFLHLLPDSNSFVFANTKSVLLDYVNHRILRTFSKIPGKYRIVCVEDPPLKLKREDVSSVFIFYFLDSLLSRGKRGTSLSLYNSSLSNVTRTSNIKSYWINEKNRKKKYNGPI